MTVAPLVEMPENPLEAGLLSIPDKMYFRVGEVSRLVGLEPYVLRFWETEFPAILPKKSGRGHRLYRRKDVELFLQIKHLLYEKRFTIEGARKALRARAKPAARKGGEARRQAELFPGTGLEQVRAELAEILKILA